MDELELINLTKQAHVAAAAGDQQSAIRLYREVLTHQPENVSVLTALAHLVDDPEEKKGYLRRALDLNPYSEEARTMLEALEGPPVLESEISESEPIEVLHCYYHPHRETTLRCNKCGKPICTECAIRTPVGYRCPDCVREQQDKFYTATSSDIIKGSVVAFIGGLLAGLAIFLLVIFLGSFLFIGFLAAFFIGPALGGAVAEVVRRSMGKRHARHFPLIGVVVMIVGMLILLLPTGFLGWTLLDIGMALLAIVLAASTFYARLKF